MKKIVALITILFLGFQINLKAQEKETILEKLNNVNEKSTYLKDFNFELDPGKIAKYSIVLSKNTKYAFSLYLSNPQLDFELFEDKTEENLLQNKEKLSEQVNKADFTPKQTGVYHIIIKNNSNKIAKSILLLSFIEKNYAIEEIIPTEKNNKSEKNIKTNQVTDEIFLVVEQMPLFGNTKDYNESVKLFKEFIEKNIIYPEEAKQKKIKGRVYVSFVVDKEGYIKTAQVVRGVHPSLDQEALRVVFTSPRWQPAKEKGIPVNISFTFPIIFELN